jgi:hypothetical protein
MATVEFVGSEGGVIPTDIDFRQVGILVNPITLQSFNTQQSGLHPANGSIYRVSTDIIVAPGFGVYVNDETVYQGDPNNPSFSAIVLSFDTASNVVRLINIKGNYTLNAPIFGANSLTARTLLDVNLPEFVPFSGYLIYVQNREGVQRSPDGIEQFKFVIGY